MYILLHLFIGGACTLHSMCVEAKEQLVIVTFSFHLTNSPMPCANQAEVKGQTGRMGSWRKQTQSL